MNDRIIAACDGAAKGNPGPAAWAYVVADSAGVPQRWQAGPLGHSTNNVGELTALERLLAATDAAVPLEVRLDSTYTRDSVTKWLKGWKRNGWKTAAGKPVANQELIQRIDELLDGRDVTFVYVPAHQVDGDPLNAVADKAASDAARTQEAAAWDGRRPPRAGPGREQPRPWGSLPRRRGPERRPERGYRLPGRGEAPVLGRRSDAVRALPRHLPVLAALRQGGQDHQGGRRLGPPRVRGRRAGLRSRARATRTARAARVPQAASVRRSARRALSQPRAATSPTVPPTPIFTVPLATSQPRPGAVQPSPCSTSSTTSPPQNAASTVTSTVSPVDSSRSSGSEPRFSFDSSWASGAGSFVPLVFMRRF